MPDGNEVVDAAERAEVVQVARGIATAVAPDGGITTVQADLLRAIADIERSERAA